MSDLKPVKTLFLVDDDTDEHELFQEALHQVNDKVLLLTAINGLDAFDKLDAQAYPRPDVIFLDLNMPKMDGLQFLREIKGMPHYQAIPIHIYTTSSNPEHERNALSLGATSFITKPDSLQDLCRYISNVTAVA
jgi:CheY-like chemotaxis protein